MEREHFEKLVAEGFEAIPEKFRKKVRNVGLLVEDEPSEGVRRQEHLGPNETLLGFYQGLPLSVRGDHYGVGMTVPDTITIYQKPIEAEAAALAYRRGGDFVEYVGRIVADTVWHEIAHHFGFNESEVRFRERKRRAEGSA